jgi:hypothetical protein
VRRRSVPDRFPARLSALFCHHRGLRAARWKRDWRWVGHRVVVPASERDPPKTRRRRQARRDRRRAVSSDSRIFSAAARGGTVGLPSFPPHARPTHAREIRFTNNDNGSAGARVAEPGRDALRQPRTARLSLFEPNFARLTALAVPLRQNRLFGSLEQGEKRINARSNSPTREGDCIGGSEFFASFA